MNIFRFAAVALLSLPAIARADSLVNFELTGTFTNSQTGQPYTAFGTIGVNTTTGVVTSVNLGTNLSNFAGDTTSFSALYGIGSPTYTGITETWMSGGTFVNSINIVIPSSLVGYTGGSICALYGPSTCGGGSFDAFQSTSNVQPFVIGSLAATPEPSSLMLLGTGIAGVFGLAKRRFRGQQA